MKPGRRAKSSARGRRIAAVLLPIAASCAAPSAEVRPSPQTLIFAPARTTATLTLENPGARPLALGRLRLDPRSPDWGSFLILDRRAPRELPALGRVEIHLAADLEHFIVDPTPGQPVHYRRGQARLLLEVEGQPLAVPIRFEGEAPVDAPVALGKLGIFALLLAAALVVIRRGRALGPTPWLFILTLALMPLGPGLCWGDLGRPLGAADLELCGAGFGGAALRWLGTDAGLLLWFAGLLALDLAAWAQALRGPAPASALRLGGRRLALDLALILGLLAALARLGSLDPAAIVAAQAGEGGLAAIAGWGLVRLPVAAALVIAAQSLRRATLSSGPPQALDRLAFAGLLTIIYFGGWSLPGVDALALRLPHLAAVIVLAAVVILKTVAVALLLGALDRWRASPRLRAWTGPRVLMALLVGALIHLAIVVVVAATAAAGP